MAEEVTRTSLREESAFQLAEVTKTAPQFEAITPRWLVHLLDWKPVLYDSIRWTRARSSSLSAHT